MTLTFNREQWSRLIDGTKHATVRRGALPLRPGHQVVYSIWRKHMALILVSEVVYKRFDALVYEDAMAEGYTTVFELRDAILRIYPDIQPFETVTVVRFTGVIWHDDN